MQEVMSKMTAVDFVEAWGTMFPQFEVSLRNKTRNIPDDSRLPAGLLEIPTLIIGLVLWGVTSGFWIDSMYENYSKEWTHEIGTRTMIAALLGFGWSIVVIGRETGFWEKGLYIIWPALLCLTHAVWSEHRAVHNEGKVKVKDEKKSGGEKSLV